MDYTDEMYPVVAQTTGCVYPSSPRSVCSALLFLFFFVFVWAWVYSFHGKRGIFRPVVLSPLVKEINFLQKID